MEEDTYFLSDPKEVTQKPSYPKVGIKKVIVGAGLLILALSWALYVSISSQTGPEDQDRILLKRVPQLQNNWRKTYSLTLFDD